MDLNALASARVVDLSLTVSERLPGTWPGHMTYAHHNWNWFAAVEGPTGTCMPVGSAGCRRERKPIQRSPRLKSFWIFGRRRNPSTFVKKRRSSQ